MGLGEELSALSKTTFQVPEVDFAVGNLSTRKKPTARSTSLLQQGHCIRGIVFVQYLACREHQRRSCNLQGFAGPWASVTSLRGGM